MELVNEISFAVYEEGEFAERFPAFQNGGFFFPFSIVKNDETKNYTLKLFPNYFFEGADLTITNDDGDAIISNVPFNLSEGVDYFQGLLDFNKHKLIYNNVKKQFEIWDI